MQFNYARDCGEIRFWQVALCKALQQIMSLSVTLCWQPPHPPGATEFLSNVFSLLTPGLSAQHGETLKTLSRGFCKGISDWTHGSTYVQQRTVSVSQEALIRRHCRVCAR